MKIFVALSVLFSSLARHLSSLIGRVRAWRDRLRRHQARLSARCVDTGSVTAEYAIATLAACGFAGLLLVILRSGDVRALLLGIIKRALSVG